MACSDVLTLLDVMDNKLMTAVGKVKKDLFDCVITGYGVAFQGPRLQLKQEWVLLKCLVYTSKNLSVTYMYLEIHFLKNIFILFYFVKNDSDYLYLP